VARKQQEEAKAGAPDWMVTYGDMMTLLLCFFVMLVALSEVKTDKFMLMLQSMRRAFGYKADRAPIPGGDASGNSPLDRIAYYELVKGVHGRKSASDRRGPVGPHDRSTTVREGARSVIGARVGFARATADLPDEGRAGLAQIADLLRGHPNKVEVRGHASREPLPRVCSFRDKRDLAYARARAVADVLIEHDIAPERIRIVSCGDGEPLKETFQTNQRWRNRRVEVLMMEAATEAFVQPAVPETLTRRLNGGTDRG